mmetsp:Transcript_5212/g.9923  ORF Transcript_5212/g.9923 Transcript_5212/m.9923 type:complete len:356 (+) Transcript_5212:176-1243(+)|eukprot:CAMPEP_0114255380 /NCGR_PEP_ID=MMETSP0058-20121206/17524_1 /TAXON_ID=36894 /ORGANISM="Pyramimonas parkeae, CCMP726" /LENGTH=355 /DNA_ID=CAMNT_0001369747 /DNA_START=115 /DNA_END=1182 /DNA_ORIENTATION=+
MVDDMPPTVITKQVMRERVDRGEPLVVCDGAVFDISPLLRSHPGGAAVLEECLGEDISAAFRGEGAQGYHEHSQSARKQMRDMFVAWLHPHRPCNTSCLDPALQARSEVESGNEGGHFVVDRTKAVVFQVGHLGPHYDKWVHTPDLSSAPMRFFQHPVLEFFSGTPWWMIPLVWLPMAVAALAHALVVQNIAAMAVVQMTLSGIIFWGFLEYTLHRFLFHSVPSTYWWITLHFLLHGCHHKRPMDAQRLVFPPILSAPIVAAITSGILAAMPLDAACCVIGGTVIGYVSYDLTHYYLHHGDCRHWSYLAFLKSTHLAHHYKDHSSGYGVTSPLFDSIFGSLPSRKASEKSTGFLQ